MITPTAAPVAATAQSPATPAADPNATGVQTPATADAPPKADPFAAKFAALSRQEKQLYAERVAYKAQREAEQREWAARLESTKRYEDLRARAKTDRAAAQELLKEAGITFDDLTKLHLNGGKPTAEMIAEQAKAETEAIRKEMAERDERAKSEAEKAKEERVTQAVASFKAQIDAVLKAKPDDFELTLNYQDSEGKTGADLIYDVIDAHYEATEKADGTGRVMSHEDAAKLVEEYLEKDYEEKILSRKKIQAKIGAKTGSSADGGSAPRAPAHGMVQAGAKPAAARTLTNADQTTVATAPRIQPKSREESLQDVAKLLRWI